MKLWIKVTLIIIFNLIPTPNIEVNFKIDFNNDDEVDLVVSYSSKDGVSWERGDD